MFGYVLNFPDGQSIKAATEGTQLNYGYVVSCGGKFRRMVKPRMITPLVYYFKPTVINGQMEHRILG